MTKQEDLTASCNGKVENHVYSNSNCKESDSDDDKPLIQRKEAIIVDSSDSAIDSLTGVASTSFANSSSDAEFIDVKPKAEKRPAATFRAKERDDDEDTCLLARKKLKIEPDTDFKKPKSSAANSNNLIRTDAKPSKKLESSVERRKSSESSHAKKKKHKHHHHHKDNDKKSDRKDFQSSPNKKVKNEEEQWRWWDEKKEGDLVKWSTMEHNGPVFAPDYEPLPKNVKFYYAGEHIKLSSSAEEIAVAYAKMLEHDYVTKEKFNKNFFKDWRKAMNEDERRLIVDLTKCNFLEIGSYFKDLSEKKKEARKGRSKEEVQDEKKQNEKVIEQYGYALVDSHKQRIGNFKIEPPGLFRGRGDHPKMGMWKRRVQPEDVIINCSKGVKIVPPEGHKWKEVRHDNTVTWLCSWTENIMGSVKYVMLNPSSALKGQKDWEKYEKARQLNKLVDEIRENYKNDWKDKEMRVRQRAVALYFIDKLALRAGNEKEEGETADTVGCCSLRVEHIKLHDQLDVDGQMCENVVEFDFLGKDSIRYYNRVPVEKRVFKNLNIFCENKDKEDNLFDRLNTTSLNEYLKSLMPGLTAKVFRTYNASHTLQEQLKQMTTKDMKNNEAELVLAYNRANRAVAVLCNHQRSVPKAHSKQMETLEAKIAEKHKEVKTAKKELKEAKKDGKNSKSVEQKKKKLQTLEGQLRKMEIKRTDKDENKEIALGTSKLNYLDPRITVQWCLKWNVPLTRVYTKTHRDKFQWAIDMVTKMYQEDGEEFVF